MQKHCHLVVNVFIGFCRYFYKKYLQRNVYLCEGKIHLILQFFFL